MHAASGQRIEIDRQGRDQRLAFAGLHFGDAAFVQDHAADQLHVEMALAERALGGFAHGGESRHQDVVERLAVGELSLKLVRARPQFVVGKRRDFVLERIDGVDPRRISPDAAVIGGTKQLAGNGADHAQIPFKILRATFVCVMTLRANFKRHPVRNTTFVRRSRARAPEAPANMALFEAS